jgi:CDP-glucose 4,6-dehydratase
MRILVTGSTGFIGSHLCSELKKEHQVVALVRDVLPSKWLEEALDGCVKVRGDVTDFHLLRRALNQYEIEQVYHLAAQSIVKTAHRDPIGTFKTNVMGTVTLLEACRQIGVSKVLIQSTDKVYGNQMEATVNSRLIPTEIYGTSKICADLVAQAFIKVYGMRVVVSRMCNVYGLDYSNRIIPNTVRACLQGQPPIVYKNDESKRQYIFIDDAVRALRFLMESEGTEGVYIIATRDIKTQEEVVREVLKHFPSLEPKYVERPELKEIYSQSMMVTSWPPHWEPKVSFEDGIKLTIERFNRYRGDWE